MYKRQIYALRAEIERLKLMAKSSDHSDRGELLSHINDMEPKNLRDLTNTAGPDVLDAMNVFIKRLLGTDDTSELSSTIAEVSNVELSRMVYWLLVVGYSLRTMEVQFEIERSLTTQISSTVHPGLHPSKEDSCE